jgi:predicted SprT family Zn-dependent metalloprotease
MAELQDYRCAICKEAAPLVIDHNHNNHKVRGLLCYSCNVGLGFFNDKVEVLMAAIQYLAK